MSAWRCTFCGKVSNAARMPRWHRNDPIDECGPFEAATVVEAGAVLAPAGSVIAAPVVASAPDPGLRYRVTTLRRFACECPRSTVLSSHHMTGSIGTSGHRGSVMHAAIAEILRTLWRANERRFERTEEAEVILREVYAAGPWVITAADMFGAMNPDGTTAQSGVKQMIGSFAQEEWWPSRFLIIEGARAPFDGEARMTTDIICPDGEIRTLSGAPDLIIASPPSTVVVVDHKQSMAKPAEPRDELPAGEPIRGMQYLTDPQGDYLQLCGYALLALDTFPAVKTVIGREKNWRWMGPPREVVFTRDYLEEHARPYFGTLMMQLDQGLREGEGSVFAAPRSGKQCATRCSVKRSCPIPAEERGLGVLDSDEAADAEGARWEVVKALAPDQRAALKTYVEETGRHPVLPDGRVIRWNGEKPNRKFGAFPPVEPAPPADTSTSDDAFVAAMEAELARAVPA